MIEGIKLFLFEITIRGLLLLMVFFIFGSFKENIFENEEIFERFINEHIILYSAVFSIFILERLYFFKKYWRFIIMPYSLKLFSNSKNEKKDTKVFLDRFKRFDHKNNIAYFKNRNFINLQVYQDSKADISHFLYIHDKPIEIDIKPVKSNYISLQFYHLGHFLDFDLSNLKSGQLFYGFYKDGGYYLDIDKQTHMLTVGESGSGKSNFMNMLIFSLLVNEEFIDYIYMIDLKGPELSRYEDLKCVSFIDKVKNVGILFENLKIIMNNRFEYMKKNNQLVYSGQPIFIIIDEVGTIGTYYDKKIKEHIFNNMIEIFQKGRAAKIILLLFAQKIDSSNIPSNVLANIQSKVLMKTESDYNINNTIGKKEEVEEITKTKVSDFNRGRAILKDGITSHKHLIQVPYLSDELQNSIIKYFKSYLS